MLKEIAARVTERMHRRPRRQWEAEIRARLRTAPPVRDFRAALRRARPAFIFEIKRRSPANGDEPLPLDAAEVAGLYQQEGASAISVLTEPDYFGGSLDDLAAVRQHVDIPLLRKDFIVDELQILEARACGADAVLLIVALLPQARLVSLIEYCRELSTTALVEVHTEAELELALAAGADTVGVNNRNLSTLKIDLGIGERLLPQIPSHCVRVAESGINSREDVQRLRRAGADAFLIGTGVIRAADRQQKIRELVHGNED